MNPERWGAWLLLFVIALACGVPINASSIAIIGLMSIWVISGGSKE